MYARCSLIRFVCLVFSSAFRPSLCQFVCLKWFLHLVNRNARLVSSTLRIITKKIIVILMCRCVLVSNVFFLSVIISPFSASVHIACIELGGLCGLCGLSRWIKHWCDIIAVFFPILPPSIHFNQWCSDLSSFACRVCVCFIPLKITISNKTRKQREFYSFSLIRHENFSSLDHHRRLLSYFIIFIYLFFVVVGLIVWTFHSCKGITFAFVSYVCILFVLHRRVKHKGWRITIYMHTCQDHYKRTCTFILCIYCILSLPITWSCGSLIDSSCQ